MSSKKRTIAMFQQRLDVANSYNDIVFNTAFSIISEQNIKLIIFFGQAVGSGQFDEYAQSGVYNLVDEDSFDGLIISQTTTQRVSDEKLVDFKNLLPKIPTISSSHKFPGLPCVFMENEVGLRGLLKHLIEVHHCKRIAHLRGPRGNFEADIRERVWREELTLARLPVYEELLIQGDYDIEKNFDVGRRVIEQTGGTFDAIFCCNDVAAIRLFEDLQASGYEIPKDFIIVGFDDIKRCQYIYPGLSTVKQPLREQTRALFLSLDAMIDGGAIEDQTVLTDFVIRGSCGCEKDSWSQGAYDDLLKRAKGRSQSHNDLNIYEMIANIDNKNTRFANSIFNFTLFMGMVNSVNEFSELSGICHDLFKSMNFSTYGLFRSVDDRGLVTSIVIDQGQTRVIPEVSSRVRVDVVSSNFSYLPEVFDLKKSGIFDKIDLSPLSCLAVLPLVHRNQWLGVLILEINEDNMFMAKILQNQMAAVLERLVNLQKHISHLAEEKTRVYLEQEKMKALTILASGVAHEVSTPIGISRTSNSYYKKLLEDIYASFESGTLTKQGMKKFLDESVQIQEIVDNSLDRSAQLLLDFRKLAIAEHREDLQEVQMGTFVKSFVFNIMPAFREQDIECTYEIRNEIAFKTWPIAIIEVLNNLATNTLVHAFDESIKQKKKVHILAYSHNDSVCIEYQNNGKSIPPESKSKIFEPFYTTRRNQGGTGLGLHIVSNLIKQKLQGTIEVLDLEPQGVVFKVVLPLHPTEAEHS